MLDPSSMKNVTKRNETFTYIRGLSLLKTKFEHCMLSTKIGYRFNKQSSSEKGCIKMTDVLLDAYY